MPLYMDIHTVGAEPFSIEDVVKAHMEDLAIQEKFGVTQIKYWVNEETQTIFCLMRGPDKESCHLVHKESHGNTACNIIEVSDNEYNLYIWCNVPSVDYACNVYNVYIQKQYIAFKCGSGPSIHYMSGSCEN